MPIFCTKCGTKNEDGAAFCDNCGAPLRPAAVAAPRPDFPTGQTTAPRNYDLTGNASPEALVGFVKSKKIIYAGAGLAALLVLGGGAMYFMLQPPAATSSTLLAAANAGYGKATTDTFKRELCVANTDYSKSTFNAGENDASTQAWMNALVTAGLYSPPVTINSGGLFSSNLLQYVATPELEKYREGSRLCVAKDVEIADVVNIEKPTEESLGRDGGSPKILTVKSRLVFKSINTAPWMEKPEVRDAVMATISGWEYKDKKLQKQVADSFGLRERKWATGTAYKAQLENQYRVAQRSKHNDDSEQASQSAESRGVFGGISSALSRMLSFGGHPLKGKWRVDTGSMGKPLGMRMPSGLGLDDKMTFTSNSIEFGGQSTKCKFEVDGNRVKVIPEGQAASLTFVMQDKDTAMLDLGLVEVKYKRVD